MTKHEEKITYEVTAQEDPDTGDVILPIPPELLQKLGWKEGDTLDWQPGENGSWYLSKTSS